MGKATNSLDWLLWETENELEKFRLVWIRYEKWICAHLKISKEIRITDITLKHEWVISNTHIAIVSDGWKNFPYVRMELSYYQAIVSDLKSSNEFRRTSEGKLLPPVKNRLIEKLKKENLWDYSK